jgi:hypothetical protein
MARDPDPQFAEKLSTGVGDLATGLAGVLRAFSSGTAKADVPDGDIWGDATSEQGK